VVTSNNEFNSVPNRVLLDWVEVDYVRTLAFAGETTSFSVPAPGAYSFRLTAGPGGPLQVFAPGSARRFAFAGPDAGTYAFTDAPDAPERYWVAAEDGAQPPVRLQRATPVDRADPGLAADYVIVTTPALLPSARAMAAYRESQDGFTVAVVLQHELFDQFDYGRPTPLAVRRFVHATRDWQVAPRFFLFWGDTNRPEADLPRRALFPWEVISFGYAPSDGWFAMQVEGPDDFIERAAIGRIPTRDNETEKTLLPGLIHPRTTAPRSRPPNAFHLTA
jgi:hypothetical protein